MPSGRGGEGEGKYYKYIKVAFLNLLFWYFQSERFKVVIGKTLTIFEKENDPSMLRSKNAGRFLQYVKKEGQWVEVGDVFGEMESMKMVINLDIRKAGGRLVQVCF